MYQFIIDEMVKEVVKKTGANPKVVEKALVKCWQDRIAYTWTVEDVQALAEERGVTLKKVQARMVLREMLSRVDSEIGMNWHVLSVRLDDYLEAHNIHAK